MFTNNCEFLINDGKLHILYVNRANDRKFSPPIAGTYQAHPYLQRTTTGNLTGAINAHQIIFDELTHSFRPYFPQASSIAQFRETVPNAVLDANNLGHKPAAIFEMGSGITACLMHINGRDSLYLFRFQNVVDEGDLAATGVNARRSLDGCEGISAAKLFASSTAGSAFFYATTNKVYGFSISSGQTTQSNIYECDPNEEITALFQMPSGGFPTSGCVLWIGVWNEQARQGKLVEFEIDPVSGTIRTQWINSFAAGQSNPHVTEGFGKIKSMIIAM
jgi:hypothetical protein